jgi:serine/threonine protein kinase
MIKVKNKNSKCRNPDNNKLFLEEYFPDIKFTLFAGGKDKEVHKFTISKSIIIDNMIIKPGKYVILLPHEFIEYYDVKLLNRINLFSKYGLIPKIYVYNKNFIIMKYIEGDNLSDVFHKFNKQEKIKIVNKIEELISVFHKLKFVHGDLTIANVLITSAGKLYIIDPNELIADYEFDTYKQGDIEDLAYIREKYNLL